MSSSPKKSRLSKEKEILRIFSKDVKRIEELKKALFALCSPDIGGIASLTINQCNAAYGKYGKPGKSFSDADVDVKTNSGDGDTIFCFGRFFRQGIDMLETFLDNPDLALSESKFDSQSELLLSKLFGYMLNTDEHGHLCTILSDKKIDECDLAIRFAEHLFSKLAVSSSNYTLDRYNDGRSNFFFCNCGCNNVVNNRFGDTSIGNTKVWHGQLDVLLDSCFLPIAVVEKGKPDSPGGKSSIEEVKTSDNFDDLNVNFDELDVTSQLLAQTIVFSFAQKKRYPEFSNFLIPTIGISKNKYMFYFYDSENDVLLKSPTYSIFENDKVSTFFILSSWMVVNYKFLCCGLDEEVLETIVKANFFKMADCQLPVYQAELSFGGIASETASGRPFEPWTLCKCKKMTMPSKITPPNCSMSSEVKT